MTSAFTILFVAALVAMLATRLWLAARQIAHVKRHREHVPEAFADRVGLAAHQKAADSTVAKTRLGIADTLVSAALLLAFTLGGGLQALFELWARAFDPGGYAHGIALREGCRSCTIWHWTGTADRQGDCRGAWRAGRRGESS